jgi:hypothetical protein
MMAEAFDPYHKWLGIGPEEQPPHHYRLLAIPLFESDPEVIENAVKQRVLMLRGRISGPAAPQARQLLTEVTAAEKVLREPGAKAAYDQWLWRLIQQAQPSSPTSSPDHAADGGLADLVGPTAPAGSSFRSARAAPRSSSSGMRSAKLWAILGLLVVTGLVVAGVVIVGRTVDAPPDAPAAASGQPAKVPPRSAPLTVRP